MDPPLISESSFSAANPSAYSLAEIWPLGSDPPGSGLRVGNGLGESGSAEESTVTEQSAGGARKRRDVSSEDESSKNRVSTSRANQLVRINWIFFILFYFLKEFCVCVLGLLSSILVVVSRYCLFSRDFFYFFIFGVHLVLLW